MSEPLKIFITYSHTNTAAKEKLKTCLAVMEQQDEITIWHDNEILPGDRWREAISNNLAESDILLYLVSADSLASKNCNKELFEAIKNTHKNIIIIPIILEDCDWQQHQLSNFQALPDRGKPINEWQPESTGWQRVVKGIRKVIKNIVDSRGKSTPDQQDQKEQLAGLGQHLLSLGNFGMMLGQVETAVETYSYAIKLQPNFAEAYCNRGIAYKEKDELNRAIQDYSKAIDLKPDLAEAYNNRGNAYNDKSEFDQAIQDFNKAIELKPDYAEAYNNRGIAYSDKGDFDQAIQDFDKAIELKSDFADAYFNRGDAYSDKGKLDQAIQDYNKAVELNPNDAEAYNNRGIDYSDKGKFDQAIQDYNKAIKLKPDYAGAYNNRGIAYAKKGNFEQAIQDYNKAIELKPNYAEAYFNRGIAYRIKGNFEQAIQDFDKAIELKPNYAEAYYNRGIAYVKKGNFEQAIQDFNEAIKLKPDSAKAYFNRGIVGLILGEWEKAKADLTFIKNMGVDIAAMFRLQYGSVADFERLFDKEHPVRKNLFFYDSLEIIRIIEGKEELKVQRRPERDPLLALAGTLTCDVTDIGERHDEYIGQALLKEMRGVDNE